MARKAGVVVEVFSVGFGPELFGWTAKSGTRWRLSAIPLGGYVKMRGDEDPASTPSGGGPKSLVVLVGQACSGVLRLLQLGPLLILSLG